MNKTSSGKLIRSGLLFSQSAPMAPRDHVKTMLTFIVAAAIILFGPLPTAASQGAQPAWAQSSPLVAMQHGPHDMKAAAPGPKDMGGTAMPMQHGSGNYSDRAYLSGMIAHHVGAVDMARAALEKGKDAQVKKWAQEVIDAQQKEINDMREWLQPLGGEDEAAAGHMRKAMQDMMAMPMSPDADVNFVVMMIDHHAGGLEMAAPAVAHSRDEKIVKLSADIITVQLKEILAYREWLKARNL